MYKRALEEQYKLKMKASRCVHGAVDACAAHIHNGASTCPSVRM